MTIYEDEELADPIVCIKVEAKGFDPTLLTLVLRTGLLVVCDSWDLWKEPVNLEVLALLLAKVEVVYVFEAILNSIEDYDVEELLVERGINYDNLD